jgi:hypothetical protein
VICQPYKSDKIIVYEYLVVMLGRKMRGAYEKVGKRNTCQNAKTYYRCF